MALSSATQALRRANLKALIEQKGGVASVAKLLGGRSSMSYLSQLTSPNSKTSFGERAARSLEQKLLLKPYTLDLQPQGEAQRFANTDHTLMTRTVDAVGEALGQAQVKPTTQQLTDLIAVVYEHSVFTGGRVDKQFLARLIRLISPGGAPVANSIASSVGTPTPWAKPAEVKPRAEEQQNPINLQW